VAIIGLLLVALEKTIAVSAADHTPPLNADVPET